MDVADGDFRLARQLTQNTVDRGEGIEFASTDDFDAFIDQIGQEVSAEIAAERKLV